MPNIEAILELTRDDAYIDQHRLADVAVTIGRATDNTIVLTDPHVSRRHAEIVPTETGHKVIDHTGDGRTRVNDETITEQALGDGDRIMVGPFVLCYRPAATRRDETHQLALTETLFTLSPAESQYYDQLQVAARQNRLDPRQQMIWSIRDTLANCTDPEQLADILLQETCAALAADRGQIVCPSAGDKIELIASRPADQRAALSQTVIRQVLATGQALACLDVGQDRRFSAVQSLAHAGARSLLAAPLVIAGRIAGAICLMREQAAGRYDENDLHALCAILRLAHEYLPAALGDAQNKKSAPPLQRQTDLPYPLVYRSEIMKQVTRQVLRVAATDATVCITGPSGAGKELIAAAIHYGSLRSDGPFIKVNCAAIPEHLIESELFGHEKGAFTDARTMRKGRFELADGGTLFLDEIGDMPMPAQTKVLRAIETRHIERVGGSEPISVQVRLIAATHRNLPAMVSDNRFREDLWYRLDVVRIELPPLAQRREDIAPLFELFAASSAAHLNVAPVQLDPEAMNILYNYDWPGNVRQVRNLAERLVIFFGGQQIGGAQLSEMLGQQGDSAEAPAAASTAPLIPTDPGQPLRPLAEARTDFERQYIFQALRQTGGNITRAAEILGLARENLSRKIKQLNIEIPSS